MNSYSIASIALLSLTYTYMVPPDQGLVSCSFIKTDMNQTPTASETMDYETTDFNQTNGLVPEVDVSDLKQSLLSLQFFPRLPEVDEGIEQRFEDYVNRIMDNDNEIEIELVEEDI